jgi:hypothetical protein
MNHCISYVWKWVIFLVLFQNINVIPQASLGDSTKYNKNTSSKRKIHTAALP